VTTAEQGQIVCGSAELLQWSVHTAGNEVTIALVGEIDLSNDAALGVALAAVVARKPARIFADLAGVSYLDSSGVRCLLSVAKLAAAAGSELVVCRPVGIVLRVLQICGVDEMLMRSAPGDRSEDQ
jgi:anti-sigma B factor antagonist